MQQNSFTAESQCSRAATKLRKTLMGDAINIRLITPKGFKKVARGWSEAETPGTVSEEGRILEGCEIAKDLSHPFRMRINLRYHQGFPPRSNLVFSQNRFTYGDSPRI